MGQMGYSGSDWSLGINKTVTFSGHTAVLAFYFYKIVMGQKVKYLLGIHIFWSLRQFGGFCVHSIATHLQLGPTYWESWVRIGKLRDGWLVRDHPPFLFT